MFISCAISDQDLFFQIIWFKTLCFWESFIHLFQFIAAKSSQSFRMASLFNIFLLQNWIVDGLNNKRVFNNCRSYYLKPLLVNVNNGYWLLTSSIKWVCCFSHFSSSLWLWMPFHTLIRHEYFINILFWFYNSLKCESSDY